MGDHPEDMKFFGIALNLDDFQGLGRKKIWRLINLFFGEFFGTAVLVFLGCSTVVSTSIATGIDHLTICVAFGFAVATAVMIFGHISGSHVNPAFSVAGVVCGQISLAMCALYTVAQCAGASFGYYLITLINPKEKDFTATNASTAASLCCTVPNSHIEVSQAVLSEAIATAIIVWSLCSAWDFRCKDKHDSLPVKFGVVVIALAIPIATYSGCSMNPARSFGPAFLTGYWENHWVYWVGPILGSLVASTIYATVFKPSYVITSDANACRDPASIKLRNSYRDDNTA